ncbi:MAG TPA: thiamine phosphate synthase, partial [Chthoniobacterales bacterium]
MTAADLSRCRLYAILDLGYVERSAATRVAESLVNGGVDLLQLRAKNFSESEIENLAHELRGITTQHDVPLIINDHPEIARRVRAQGVHLGQDDMSVADARAIVGADCA